MKTRYKIIIGIFVACMAVAVGIWMEVRKAHRMQEALEQALEQNRNYVPFTSDTIVLASDTTQRIPLRHVAAYYNAPLRRFLSRHSSFFTRHSSFFTLNSSLIKSLYALGCVYRDLHEAPIALLTWEDAIAAADTTSADCDYATLYRVYGQMAEVYFRQYMPEKQIEAQQKYSDYALKAGDTLIYIRGLLKRNDAYLLLGDTSAIFDNIDYVRQLYIERGLSQQAAQVYPSAIHIAVDRGEYKKAYSMMQIFEKESGLFDENGNIAPTREIYYYHKGRYYAGVGLLDSAEYQFRRLLNYEPNLVDAYRGLLMLYQLKQNADSIYKYSILYEGALGDYLKDTKSAAIVQAKGMYDYNRQEGVAKKQAIKAGRLTYALTCIVFIMLIASIYAVLYHQKKEEEKANLVARYSKVVDDLSKTKHEVQLLRESITKDSSIKKLLKEKEEQIKEIEDVVKKLQKRMGCSAEIISLQKLDETAIVKKFKAIIEPHYEDDADLRVLKPARAATEKEWEMMKEVIQVCHPNFYLLIHKHKLSPLKFKVCVLSYLGFKNPEISILSGASMDSIPNARRALAKELFHLDSAHDLDEHLRQIEPLS